MPHIYLLNDGGIRIDVGRRTITSTLEELQSEKVLDDSRESCFLRAWKNGEEIHVAHQFGHDVAWPHDVYIFPFPTEKITNPVNCFDLHEYLAMGNGIPPAEKKG